MEQAQDDLSFVCTGYMKKMCRSLWVWLMLPESSALFHDHDWIHRLTPLMGLVQYMNWGNALPTLHTGTCYLSACVYASVSVCTCMCYGHFSSSWALCLHWQPWKKGPFNDFTVWYIFSAVDEPSSNILHCMYYRIESISVKKVH